MSAEKDQDAPAGSGAKKSDGAKRATAAARRATAARRRKTAARKRATVAARRASRTQARPETSKKVPTPRLMERYFKEIVPALLAKFGRTNILSLPRLKKIVINMGVGEAITEKKLSKRPSRP